ncbi:hypothetical protein Rcae01_03914 [Novipirellula caenicola]|uniref:Uncharacterized protein n=1 Tax=Novipirellula caenicola TaxID=1536901 RepID=A0ABP9VXY0_9BACT
MRGQQSTSGLILSGFNTRHFADRATAFQRRNLGDLLQFVPRGSLQFYGPTRPLRLHCFKEGFLRLEN